MQAISGIYLMESLFLVLKFKNGDALKDVCNLLRI